MKQKGSVKLHNMKHNVNPFKILHKTLQTVIKTKALNTTQAYTAWHVHYSYTEQIPDGRL